MPEEHHKHTSEHEHNTHAHHTHHHDEHTRFSWFFKLVPFLHHHHHDHSAHLETTGRSDRGIRALWISLIGLSLTALFQVCIFAFSGSVSLLADTIHNFADALTALPLWLAFTLTRRAPNHQYTYGYARAEDLAGAMIVLIIFASAIFAGYESFRRLLQPESIQQPLWVIAAGVIGFLGNEAVAIFRIRVGRQINSTALIADGQHARADGITSLAVVIGALGSMLHLPYVDPIIGLLITVIILFIVKDTAITMWKRLMDAIDPEIIEEIQKIAETVKGVESVHNIRGRWLGNRLEVELHIVIDEDKSTRESHDIGEEVRHALLHASIPPSLSVIHVDPCGHNGLDPHKLIAHHFSIKVP